MGVGYTWQDLHQVRTTGLAPKDARQRVRNPMQRQQLADLWAAQQGLEANGGYAPAQGGYGGPYPYGSPGDGRYAGYDTRGEMDDYVRGRGIQLDQEAQAWYESVANQTDQYLGGVGQKYDDLIASARTDMERAMPQRGDLQAFQDRARADDPYQEAMLGQWMSQRVQRGDSYVEDAGTPTIPGYDYLGVRPNTSGDIWHAIDNVEWGVDDFPTSASSGTTGEFVEGLRATPVPLRLNPQMDVMSVPTVAGTPAVTRQIGDELWKSNIIDSGKLAEFGNYQDQLGEWRTGEQDAWGNYLADAEAQNNLDLHEWAQMAGVNELGMDPAFAAGAYGPELTASYLSAGQSIDKAPIGQFEIDRDRWALETYGVPYDEWAAEEKAAAAQQDAYMTEQDKLAAEAEQTAFANEFAAATGFDPDALASSVDLPVEMLVETVNSPEYADALDVLQGFATIDGTRIAEGEQPVYDPEQALLLADELAKTDPVLYRLLKTMRPELFPKSSLVP